MSGNQGFIRLLNIRAFKHHLANPPGGLPANETGIRFGLIYDT